MLGSEQIAAAEILAARERRSTPMNAAEACGLNGTPKAAARALASGSAPVTGAKPCREACTAKAPPPRTEISARQPTWRVETRRGYADGARRAWYADQIRRHSIVETDTTPACWSR